MRLTTEFVGDTVIHVEEGIVPVTVVLHDAHHGHEVAEGRVVAEKVLQRSIVACDVGEI